MGVSAGTEGSTGWESVQIGWNAIRDGRQHTSTGWETAGRMEGSTGAL